MNNGIHHNGKNCDFKRTYPGCFGRIVSLFELNIGVSANRLLNDKPHRDGFVLSRTRSDVSRMSPSGDPIEERVMVPESKHRFSNRKSNGTPTKMLVAQEMSKEVDSQRDPPNLVAKLMGLDAFPQQQPDSVVQRSHSRSHAQSHSDIPVNYREQQNGFFRYVEPNECKNVWQRSQRSPHVARYEETINDRKMALVRQKFIEAKRLSMNENLCQSKQFQDALEVLSSNEDLFLDCLHESGSMFSKNIYGQRSVPHPPETKRITVLRPSRIADSNDFAGAGNKDGKQMKKGAFFQLNGLEKVHPQSSPPASLKSYENSTQPTQIVVLKPSPGKACDIRAVGSPHSELSRILQREELFRDVEDDDNQESREVAKAITQQMRETLGRQCKDETLVSSVLSNGYLGDEISFNKSEIEFADGNLSDAEAISPVSGRSWDYFNRLSPNSSSPFTRTSYSPESSVSKEARKRLSERWAMMASNRISQEQRHFQRSSSTLGEMLALSETKTASSCWEEGSSSQEPKDLDIPLVSAQRRVENMDKSPRTLMRSKSVPVSTTEYGSKLTVGISVSDKGKPESLKDTKARSDESSSKGKASSLFFSRNKSPGLASDIYLFPGEICSDRTEGVGSPLLEPSSKASSSSLVCKQGMISSETGLAAEKPIASGNSGENLDQPSPISVLDPPFEEDEHLAEVFPHYADPGQQGVESLLKYSIGSQLIDKSPPIGSIARSLSWDNSCINATSSRPPKNSLTTQEIDEEEQERFSFVKTLLSVAGLEGEVQSNSFLTRWHSLESPLDQSLRDKLTDLKDKKTLRDATQRQKRLVQKLVFDCVNAALVDIAGYESLSSRRSIPYIGDNNFKSESASSSSSTMLDKVWNWMNVWFSCEVRGELDDCADNSSMVVRKEVVGWGWSGHFRLEMDNLGKEIEDKLLEELVQEVVLELN